eukprot:TRINITY_DN3153_c0_g1_i2.p2 TRINITY_DN3153_c0_g1~~TRINITY_DN3153_c0_g1_i2.p2  ORF type:complete len:328 (+),score=22.70 TRINITY_DN3153_c0_g1_i2:56-985(+)
MEVSQDFYQIVRQFAEQLGWSQEAILSITKEHILKSRKPASQFMNAAQGVVSSLSDMRAFILQNRDAYVHVGQVSESQRDQMEHEVSEFVKTCSQRIQQLNASVQHGGNLINKHTKAHLLGVVLILSEKLQQTTQLFDQCKSMRYQAAMEQERRKRSRAVNRIGSKQTEQMLHNLQERQQQHQNVYRTMNGGTEAQAYGQLRPDTDSMLEQESIALANEILQQNQRVNTVESTVQEIAVFNQMLTSQLVSQAHQIEQLYSEAIEATHHIEAGNVQLKKTIEVNKGSNIYWIMLFVMLIFVLLFMDWYIG